MKSSSPPCGRRDGLGKFPSSTGRRDSAEWRWEKAMKYNSFSEFYLFYLSEHSDRACRRLHFVGSMLALLCLLMLLVTCNPWWFAAGLVCGYGFAWFAHFAFEKNRPATFQQPLYSLMGDWKMFWQMLTGRIAF
jgi:hypothetical protein